MKNLGFFMHNRGRYFVQQGVKAGGADTDAPSVPANLAASSITATTLTLTWDPSTDNVGVVSYEVEQAVGAGAFAWLATVAHPTVTLAVSGLVTGTEYRFRVRAVDAVGNVSAWGPSDMGLSASTTFVWLDPSFNGQVDVIIDDGAGGKYVGGRWTSVTCNVTATTYTTGYTRLVHLLPGGAVDAAWSCPVTNKVGVLALDVANDRLFVGGQFNGAASVGGVARDRLALVTASTGAVVTGWTCNANGEVVALALDVTNDRLFVGGVFNGAASVGGVARDRLALVTASTGAVVTGWTCNAIGDSFPSVLALALDVTNDRLFVGGQFSGAASIGGVARDRLALVTASTGAVVTGWTCNANALVQTLALDVVNDRLFVGGQFSGAASIGGVTRQKLALVTASTGAVVTGWTCNADSGSTAVRSLALDVANNRLFAGGNYIAIGGQTRGGLALVTASTGAVATGWICNTTFDGVFTLSLDVVNDRLFVGGSFNGATSFDGVSRARFGTTIASTGVTP